MAIEVLIFGAGAVGAFYGSRLAQTARVSCVCRSNYSAVKSHGFRITSPIFNTYQWCPIRVFPNGTEAKKSDIRWDYIVVSTKALPDVNDDSQLLDGLVHDGTSIVLLQNGLGVEQPYHARFPSATILSAVTIVSAAQPRPGTIEHARWTRVNIGPYLTGVNVTESTSARAKASSETFVSLLQSGGIRDTYAYTHAQMQLLRWHKVAINAAMNPSSVLSGGCSPAEMASDLELSAHLKGVIEEVLSTAPKVVGTEFTSDFADAEAILASVRKNKTGSMPSMWADWVAGKPMELEVIMGNAIRTARGNGIEMPRLQSLYALLKMAQRKRDGKDMMDAKL